MCKVRVNGMTHDAPKGMLLSEFLIHIGASVAHPCGGRGSCGKCTVTVNGQKTLSCQYRIQSDIDVVLPEKTQVHTSGEHVSGRAATPGDMLVLDMGSTTLVMALLDGTKREVKQIVSRTNPQLTIGADVISRIAYCTEHTVSSAQAMVVDEVNRMIASFGAPLIDTMVVAGNATMLHIFFGADCSTLGVFPYRAVFLEEKRVFARDIGVLGVEHIVSLPSFHTFVGADLVAGVSGLPMPDAGKYNLLVDLGTNAEVVLYSSERILCTAAAAGPCFEGGNISCGMSATDGAIQSFSLDGHKASYETIGGKDAVGICGTGLIDIVCALLRAEIIEESGYMEEDYRITKNILLTKKDVREVQLAKSAICSAIQALIIGEGLSFDDIDTLYISGGFSTKLNLENARRLGLFPAVLANRCVPMHNTCLNGLVGYAYGSRDLSRLQKKATYIDLSASEVFSRLFMENMAF